MSSARDTTIFNRSSIRTGVDSPGSAHRYSPYQAWARRSAEEERRGQRRTATASSSHLQGMQGMQLFCNSNNVSMGACTVNNVGGDMIFYENDPEELAHLLSGLRAILRALPPVVGFTGSNALIMTDALGETLTIPWSLVPTFEELHPVLVSHFRSKIGEQRVSSRRYCIAQAGGSDGGAIVTAGDWSSVRDKNKRLVMSMLIEQIPDKELRNVCPKCGRTDLGTYIEDGWHVCRRCNTKFLLPGGLEPTESLVPPNTSIEDLSFRHVRRCEVTQFLDCPSFERIHESARNVDALSAWRSITSHPRFRAREVDISWLCAEFTSRARYDGTKVVFTPAAIVSIVEGVQHEGGLFLAT